MGVGQGVVGCLYRISGMQSAYSDMCGRGGGGRSAWGVCWVRQAALYDVLKAGWLLCAVQSLSKDSEISHQSPFVPTNVARP